MSDEEEKLFVFDRDKIRDAIASTKDLMTVQGLLKEFRDDGVGVCPAAIMQWQNQMSEVVWHEEYTSASFVYPIPEWSQR